jgi:hypothetical protein
MTLFGAIVKDFAEELEQHLVDGAHTLSSVIRVSDEQNNSRFYAALG